MCAKLSHDKYRGKQNYETITAGLCFLARVAQSLPVGDELRERVFRWIRAYKAEMHIKNDAELAKILGLRPPQLSIFLDYEKYKHKEGKLPALGLDAFISICNGLGESPKRVAGQEPDYDGADPGTPSSASPAAHTQRRQELGGGSGRET